MRRRHADAPSPLAGASARAALLLLLVGAAPALASAPPGPRPTLDTPDDHGAPPLLLDAQRLAEARLDGRERRFRVALDHGRAAELTLEPKVQKMAERVLGSHEAPYQAAVMLRIDDGRVLAMAGRSSKGATEEKSAAELCLEAWAPAASIFKLVTAAALVDAGINPSERVCYHGGVHSVEPSNLVDHPNDRECRSFAFGLAKSQNAIIARLVHDHLKPETIERFARLFGWGRPIDGDLVTPVSEAIVPRDALAFARVSAGFWQSTLSPLHGAVIAATIARGGTTPPLHMVSRVVEGKHDRRAEPPAPRRVLDEETARTIARMMVGTTQFGTARRFFHDRDGNPYLRRIAVAGKTGSLTRREGGYLAYSWFVGFAPARKPEVAVAVLLGNAPDWKVKAGQVARELLSGYFRGGRTVVAAR